MHLADVWFGNAGSLQAGFKLLSQQNTIPLEQKAQTPLLEELEEELEGLEMHETNPGMQFVKSGVQQ